MAEQADAAGVSLVTLRIDDKDVKVITNGCVDAQAFFSFDVKECGINERCSFRGDPEDRTPPPMWRSRRSCCAATTTSSIGRTVTTADIFASINYLNGLAHRHRLYR